MDQSHLGRSVFPEDNSCESRSMFAYAWSTFDTDGEASKAGTCDKHGRCRKPKHVGWAHFSPASIVDINGGTDDGHYDAYRG